MGHPNRTRKIEISMMAFPEGVLGAECSASVELVVPPGTDLATGQKITQAMAHVLAGVWGIDPTEVKASVLLVDSVRDVVSGGDVRVEKTDPRIGG